MKPKVMIVCGTRPDAIKVAPVVIKLKEANDINTTLIVSGQHREMLLQALQDFGITPDEDLQVMKPGQTLAYITSSVLSALDESLQQHQPDMVVAQGDTTTTFVAALAAFYRSIPFAHIEAGLRTETIDSPFPEEFNRRATAQIARLHFAPTKLALDNLLAERIDRNDIVLCGNTSIDAIQSVARLRESFHQKGSNRMILVTTHRRENWGEPQRRICNAIKTLINRFHDVTVLLPMHKNEAVRSVLREELGNIDRVTLIEPPGYKEFAGYMKSSFLILTDSGGIQEEAPALGVPVLVLRDETERPEGIDAGNALLVGTDPQKIVREASSLLTDSTRYAAMSRASNPYGDGLAAQRIVSAIRKWFGLPFEAIQEFRG
jgi:UDP-N-acetylglucosamine 2-epimerase